MKEDTQNAVYIYKWEPIFKASPKEGSVHTPFMPEEGYEYVIVKTSSNFIAMNKVLNWLDQHEYKLLFSTFSGISDEGVGEGIKKVYINYALVYRKYLYF